MWWPQEDFEIDGSLVVGRADDLSRITELLSSVDETNLNSTVVSIVADRGTGRTTMLHLLHNELCSAFDLTKFICMPEKFDEKGIMRMIIESLTGTPCDTTDLEVLMEILKEELMDQRLLLLLDNFENKSQKCWNLLSTLLKFCKRLSAVVVTATRKAVSEVKGPLQFYYMNNLSKEWCWMIFKQGVFSGEAPDTYAKLAYTGELLLSKCKNVTLCIKVLSGLLRHSITDDWWRAVLENNFWKMDEVDEDIPPALRVCYGYLPSHLKQCLKYCSLFPKEYIFSKRHLVRLWLSQGFIKPGEGRELEDVGTEYFEQLLSLSLFQPSFLPGMKEDNFMMPGLVHDLAQKFSKNECFQFDGCLQRAPENACHLSLIPHEFQSISLNHVMTRAQHLQTFMVVSRSAFHHWSISSSIINLVNLKDLFLKFCSLLTLNLNNTDIEELPESLGLLTNLRYLNLSGTKIKQIPLEISNLIHLQTLEAKNCHYLEELPKSIDSLTNLRYLDVTNEAGNVVMPRGIGKLTHLRGLGTFNIGSDSLLHCGIEELQDMEHLKGSLQISGIVNVRRVTDAIKANMRSKENIESLCFHWSDRMSLFEGEEGAEIAEEVLESLHPTDDLREIIIRDYPGINFPTWTECAAFSRLVSIIFDHCYNCERLPALGGLPLLRFLSIQKMYCVQRMNLSGSENIPENIIRYPSLEQLNIWEMYELVEWVEIGSVHFPVLHSLCINKCPLLKNIPKFRALVEFSASSCELFLETMDLPSIQFMRIEGLQKTKSLNLPKNLVGLRNLEISYCPELLSIEGLSLLNYLGAIMIFRCPQLDSRVLLDERFVLFEEKVGSSVWLCKEKLGLSDKLDFGGSGLVDVGQDHPLVSKKRQDREDQYSLSGDVIEGQSKVEEPESKMSKKESELVDTTVHASGSGITQDPHAEGSEHLKVSSKRKKPTSRSTAYVRVTNSSSGKSPLDDGFSWRKYGQKDILGSKYPRGYYRCTYRNSQGCLAIKQVQRSDEDPTIFEICYQGKHTCSDSAVMKPAVQSAEVISASARTSMSSILHDSSGHTKEEAWTSGELDYSMFALDANIESPPFQFDYPELNFDFE